MGERLPEVPGVRAKCNHLLAPAGLWEFWWTIVWLLCDVNSARTLLTPFRTAPTPCFLWTSAAWSVKHPGAELWVPKISSLAEHGVRAQEEEVICQGAGCPQTNWVVWGVTHNAGVSRGNVLKLHPISYLVFYCKPKPRAAEVPAGALQAMWELLALLPACVPHRCWDVAPQPRPALVHGAVFQLLLLHFSKYLS